MQNSTSFENNVFYWDGQFHQDGVGYHQATGTTIDHVLLGYATGLPSGPPVMASNPRNEVMPLLLRNNMCSLKPGVPHHAAYTRHSW